MINEIYAVTVAAVDDSRTPQKASSEQHVAMCEGMIAQCAARTGYTVPQLLDCVTESSTRHRLLQRTDASR